MQYLGLRQNAAVVDQYLGLKLQQKKLTTSHVTRSDVPPNTILWRGNPMRTISSRPNRNRWTFNASHFPFGLISTYLANMFPFTRPKKSLNLNWDRHNFNPIWGQCVKHGIAIAESEINGICCRLWLVLAKTTFGWAAVRIEIAYDRKPRGWQNIWGKHARWFPKTKMASISRRVVMYFAASGKLVMKVERATGTFTWQDHIWISLEFKW